MLPIGVAAAASTYIIANKHEQIFSSRDISLAGVLLGLAIALSYVGVRMPLGGRITFASSLPIMLFCYYFGFRKGVVMVVAFLAFQFIQGPWIIHPVQAVMDYVVAYLALIAFAALNKNINDKYFKTPVLFLNF